MIFEESIFRFIEGPMGPKHVWIFGLRFGAPLPRCCCHRRTIRQKRSQMLFSRRIFGKQPKIVIPLRRTCWVEGIQQLRGRILTSYPPRVNNCGQFTWYLTPCLCDQAWITDHLPTSHLHVFIECPTILADPLGLWVNHKTRRSTQRDSP